MDTSETYIHQCDCVEVQQSCKVQSGDYFFCCCRDIEGYPDGYGVNVITSNDADHGNLDLIFSKTDVWLPRQDQIQEMIDDWPTIIIYHHGGEYLIEMKPEGEVVDEKGFKEMFGKYYAKSLEQAWLMLYVHQKHGKTWDKERWVDLNCN